MTDHGAEDHRAALEAEARRRLMQMLGGDTDELRADREAWLAQALEHRAAFARVRQRHDDAAILKHSAKYGVDRPQGANDDGETASVDERPAADRGGFSKGSDRFRPRGAWIWMSAAAAAVAIPATYMAQDPIRLLLGSPAQAAALVTTRHGEIRNVRLGDGSTVTLDTDSRLEVAITTQERRVRLAQGRIRIAVVADTRPFHIDVGNGRLQTHRAVLDVSYDDRHHVALQLISGKAVMQPTLRSAVLTSTAHPLLQGQPLAYDWDTAQPVTVPAEVRALDRSQWPDGWVEARSIRLQQLIDEANRYAAKPIVIDDPALRATEMTGRYKVADTQAFVSRLAETLGLRVEHRSDGTHLHPQ